MSSTSSQPCTHPVRDVTTVFLVSAVVALVAAIVAMVSGGGPLEICGFGGGSFAGMFMGGMTVLHHFKRTA